MSPDKVTITTGSRLHFGLFGAESRAGRSFGGVGLMIESPGLSVTAERADTWSATGPLGERALSFARRFAENAEAQSCRITVETAAREHVGLGTGTQFALAVAKAVATLSGLTMNAVEFARRVGRGKRSGIGVHGFDHGGLLVDGGKGPNTIVAPLIARHDFPEEWQIVLCYPGGTGMAGDAERQAFDQLSRATPAQTDRLCTLALKGILPALVERDLQSFGEAVYEFNRHAGELFVAQQGGIYASARTAELVQFIRDQGIRGVGQSSWGPTVFAIAEAERATSFKTKISEAFGLDGEGVTLTRALNKGAESQAQVD